MVEGLLTQIGLIHLDKTVWKCLRLAEDEFSLVQKKRKGL